MTVNKTMIVTTDCFDHSTVIVIFKSWSRSSKKVSFADLAQDLCEVHFTAVHLLFVVITEVVHITNEQTRAFNQFNSIVKQSLNHSKSLPRQQDTMNFKPGDVIHASVTKVRCRITNE
jgi:hypothetical protein